MTPLPLEGIRIVDLTTAWSGPGGTMLLGDLGAEVIFVESLTRDRRMAPASLTKEQAAKNEYVAAAYPDRNPEPHPYNRHAGFNWHARNKLSVTLPPLQTPEGREALLRLVEKSDVFVENNSARTLTSLRIDSDVLHERNPNLIVVRAPAMGLSGPMSGYLGYGPNFNSLVGIGAMDGYEGDDPTSAGENYHMDEATSAGLAFAVMSALWQRQETEHGSIIEFPQAENVLQEIGDTVLEYQLSGRMPRIQGNSHPTMLQGVFGTAEPDRWLAITVRHDSDWDGLVALANGELSAFAGADPVTRVLRAPEIRDHIASWARSQPVETMLSGLRAARVPAEEVLTESQVLEDPHLRARGWFQRRRHPETGEHLYPGRPWLASEFETKWGRPFPALGEDNEYVYRTVMGYTDAEYEAAIAAGYVGSERRA